MELKNYINVRVQSHNNNKIIGVMKHNLRNIKSLNQENNDMNFFYDFDNNKWLEMNNENKKSEYQKLSKKFKQDREEHTSLNLKKKGQNIRDERQGSYFEGIFTFSEKINEDLDFVYSLEDLQQVALKCLKQIGEKYKTELRGFYLHMDETTPHFHFLMRNFNDEDMSLYFKNKNKKFLSELQDLAFENFKVLGMKRGIKKEITNKTYKTTKEFHERDIKNKINMKKQLEEEKEEKLKELENLRKFIIPLQMEVNQKKEIYECINNLKKTYRKDKTVSLTEDEIEKHSKTIEVIRNIINNSKTTLRIIDEDFLSKSFTRYLLNKLDSEKSKIKNNLENVLVGVEEQKNKIEELENDLKVKNNELEETIKSKDIEITKLKELDPNKQLEEENVKLQKHVNYYLEELKSKTKQIEENREKIKDYEFLKIDVDELREKNKKQEEKIKEQDNFIEQIYTKIKELKFVNYFTDFFKKEEDIKQKNPLEWGFNFII